MRKKGKEKNLVPEEKSATLIQCKIDRWEWMSRDAAAAVATKGKEKKN